MNNDITIGTRVIGWLGVLFILGAYVLLTLKIITGVALLYHILMLCGIILLAYRVWIDRNYSNLFMQFMFIAVACYALFHIFIG